METNLSKSGIARAILDDLDVNLGGSPKSESEHDKLIEKMLAGDIPPTEPVSMIYATLRWLEDHKVATFVPDKKSTYQPPEEWKAE